MNHKHLKNSKKINVKMNDIRMRLNGSTVVQRFSTTGPWTGSRPLVIPYKAREGKKKIKINIKIIFWRSVFLKRLYLQIYHTDLVDECHFLSFSGPQQNY